MQLPSFFCDELKMKIKLTNAKKTKGKRNWMDFFVCE